MWLLFNCSIPRGLMVFYSQIYLWERGRQSEGGGKTPWGKKDGMKKKRKTKVNAESSMMLKLYFLLLILIFIARYGWTERCSRYINYNGGWGSCRKGHRKRSYFLWYICFSCGLDDAFANVDLLFYLWAWVWVVWVKWVYLKKVRV